VRDGKRRKRDRCPDDLLDGPGDSAPGTWPCAGFYSIAIGFVALVSCWVVAITLRVLYFGGTRDTRRNRYT